MQRAVDLAYALNFDENLTINLTILCDCRKTTKVLIDHVKVVIKSGKKHTSHEKLRSLQLLDRSLMEAKANKEFIVYFGKKMMDRLKIHGGYHPKDMQASDPSNLRHRGAHIFAADETDTDHAAQYLILLLNCLRKWAQAFPRDQTNMGESIYAKTYNELRG